MSPAPFSPSPKPLEAKPHRDLRLLLCAARFDALPLRTSRFARFTSTTKLPRNVTRRHSFCVGPTPTCCGTKLTSVEETSTRAPSPQLATCSQTTSFQLPVTPTFGALEASTSHKERTGFRIMQWRPCTWRVQRNMVDTSLTMKTSGYHVFPFLRVAVLPGTAVSHAAPKLNSVAMGEAQASKKPNAFASALPSSPHQVPLPRNLRLVLPRQEILPYDIQLTPPRRETFPTPIQFHAPSAPCRLAPFWREHANQHTASLPTPWARPIGAPSAARPVQR